MANSTHVGLIRIWILVGLFCLGLTSFSFAQEDPTPGLTAQQNAQAHRKEWLRKQLGKLISDPREREEINARVDRLSDGQVQSLISLCLDELEARRRKQLQLLKEANKRERALQEQAEEQQAFREQLLQQFPFQPGFNQPGFYPGFYQPGFYQPGFYAPAIGYIPVITWLPEGASLNAQAVVSPDGRHVRLSVVPFFSSIGPVYTFNYMTGETRRYDP